MRRWAESKVHSKTGFSLRSSSPINRVCNATLDTVLNPSRSICVISTRYLLYKGRTLDDCENPSKVLAPSPSATQQRRSHDTDTSCKLASCDSAANAWMCTSKARRRWRLLLSTRPQSASAYGSNGVHPFVTQSPFNSAFINCIRLDRSFFSAARRRRRLLARSTKSSFPVSLRIQMFC